VKKSVDREKKVNIRTVFSAKNTLKSMLVKLKPKSERPKKEVIYKIPCECSKVYIGETGRTLNIRLNEHKKSIIERVPNISKLAEHVIDTNHRILWNESQVIGHESHWKTRKFQEAAEMYRGGDMIII
jgi:predicted GIY-YIG superfamily endonuclease